MDEVDGLPEVLLDVYGFFTDPERVIEVGRAACTAHDLLGPEGWDDYVRAVGKNRDDWRFTERIGLEPPVDTPHVSVGSGRSRPAPTVG